MASVPIVPPALADICKYLDPEGRIIYSNVEIAGARRLDCPIVTSEPVKRPPAEADTGAAAGAASPAPARTRAATPAGFPRVDGATQRSRDEMRRRVLSEELASEEKSLADARVSYNNGTPAVLPEEKGDPRRYADRLSRLRQTVQLHERNVEALRRELANIR